MVNIYLSFGDSHGHWWGDKYPRSSVRAWDNQLVSTGQWLSVNAMGITRVIALARAHRQGFLKDKITQQYLIHIVWVVHQRPEAQEMLGEDMPRSNKLREGVFGHVQRIVQP
jgi:hypothetical protein